jgi:putative transposase
VLKREGVVISMDGRGRVFDNIFVERLWRSVKYEDVYLKGYATIGELMVGLAEYFAFYNGERPHQSLGNAAPADVYRNGIGGGALILDKFGRAGGESPVPLRSTGDSPPAVKAKSRQSSQKQSQRQHRGSAVQLLAKFNAQLKLG